MDTTPPLVFQPRKAPNYRPRPAAPPAAEVLTTASPVAGPALVAEAGSVARAAHDTSGPKETKQQRNKEE